MAGAAQLVAAMSQVTGLAPATVIDLDRKLAKAGLREIGGRGLNAAQMGSLDVARLLTAVLASSRATASAATVERYASTRIDESRSSNHLYAAARLDDLSALPDNHSFVSGLAALIGSASNGSLASMLAAAEHGWSPHIEVFAFTRATRGRIRMSGLPDGRTTSVEYALPLRASETQTTVPIASPIGSAALDALGDLEQSRRVTERTILFLAKMLATESSDV